jgi:hypothetical protein
MFAARGSGFAVAVAIFFGEEVPGRLLIICEIFSTFGGICHCFGEFKLGYDSSL